VRHLGLRYFRAGNAILPISGIREIDTSNVDLHEATVVHDAGTFLLTGSDAIELLMVVKPTALEGRRLRWVRHAWTTHNMLGHPLMQVLAWMGKGRLGVWVHDATTPRPQNFKETP